MLDKRRFLLLKDTFSIFCLIQWFRRHTFSFCYINDVRINPTDSLFGGNSNSQYSNYEILPIKRRFKVIRWL